jgi:hypothetical protein
MLVECAWSYQFPPRLSKDKQVKVEAVPQAVREIAWKAQSRLNHRYRALLFVGSEMIGGAMQTYNDRLREKRRPLCERFVTAPSGRAIAPRLGWRAIRKRHTLPPDWVIDVINHRAAL